MKERRAVHIALRVDRIDALGWWLFEDVRYRARAAAFEAGWPDWATVDERLEWRHARDEPFYGQMIATFEVTE